MVVLFCLGGVSLVESGSSTGDRLLIILKDSSLKVSHSSFLNSFKDRGFKTTVATVKDNNVVLQKYGEFQYDHLLLLVSGVDDFAPKIAVSDVLSFIDSGRSVFLITDNQVGDPVADLASECGLEFDVEDSFVIDHFNHHSDDKIDHTLIVSNQFSNVSGITQTGSNLAPVLFRGVSHIFVEENNGLNLPLLSGYSTSYSFFLDKQIGKKTPNALGKSIQLVSLLQARNNARVVFSGSLDLFSDKFFETQVQVQGKTVKSGNQEFAKRASEWAFQEKGVLRVESIHHSNADSGVTPSYYTVKDNLHYSIKISTWNGAKWVPFQASDVQLDFVRLDPWVRTFLTPDENGNFNTTFIVPDVYGVYSFVVSYARPGYSFLSTKDVIPVRPFRHNQYERFIVAAYPYYASAFSMLVGLFLFSSFFLYTKEETSRGKKTN